MAITWALFLEGPEMIAHLESRSKIPNRMITELFFTYILNIIYEQRFSLYNTYVSGVYFSPLLLDTD